MKPTAVHIPQCFGQYRWLTFGLEPDDDKYVGHRVGYNASKSYVPFNQFASLLGAIRFNQFKYQKIL